MTGYTSITSLGTAQVATGISHVLAEGPVWDPIRASILWVDILAGLVYSGRLVKGGIIDVHDRLKFPDTAGAVAVSASGDLVVAGTRRLHYRGADGGITSGAELIDTVGRRFNDGKPDPRGQLVVGTKGPGGEVLIRVEPDRTVTTIDSDLGLANGLAWSVDGRRLFNVDTLSRQIFVRSYDPSTGEVGERTEFIALEDGYPDGMTIDAEDHVWVAIWGEGCVLRIDPAGHIVARVDVPAPHASCPAFVGPSLDTLVITTATEGLTPLQLQQYPLSGRLFTIQPGISGATPHLWSGTR